MDTMSEVLKVEIAVICISHIVMAIIFLAILSYLYVKVKWDFITRTFFLMQLSIIGWIVFKIGKTVSYNVTLRWTFVVLYYACICSFEVFFLEAFYSHYKKKRFSLRIKRFFWSISLCQFLIVLTNPWHYLFYSYFNFFDDAFGVLFYVHSIIEYVFIFVGLFYAFQSLRRELRHKNWSYNVVVIVLIVFPLVLNGMYITRTWSHWVRSMGIDFWFDITPLAFLTVTTVFLYVILREQFLTISPIMRHEVVDNLDTSIVISASNHKIVFMNKKVKGLFGGKSIAVLEQGLKEHFHLVKQRSGGDVLQNTIRIANYDFIVSSIVVTSFKSVRVITTLNNITEYKNSAEELMAEEKQYEFANQELRDLIDCLKEQSMVGARKYVGRELHDVIGHSLVVVIKLLEVCKIYIGKDNELAEKSLADSIDTIDVGIATMENISSEVRDYKGYELKKDLEGTLRKLGDTNIITHLNFKGEYYTVGVQIYDAVSRICTELVTNSLKHSECREILVSVVIGSEQLSLLVMDNGDGCDNIVYGNGLKGIAERVGALNGVLETKSEIDEGFTAKVSIPL